MKRIGRIFLWIIGSILVLGCVLLLATNLYVQSQGTHRRIQQELSERLDTPLRLRQISITPWSGLKLNGIVIPQDSDKVQGNFLEAQSFELRVKFWSLFGDHLVIRQVMLNKPVVLWAQNAAGKWRLPELPPPQKPSPPAVVKAPPRAARKAPPVAPSSPLTSAPPPNDSTFTRQPDRVFTPEVQRVTLKEGDFTFLAANGRLIARFSGLDFHSAFRTATALKGNVRVEKISLRDRFFLEDLQSPLHYDPTGLAFSNISARAAGGNISGKFEMQLQAVDSPFTADVKFRDLQADKLLNNAGGPLGMLQGRVEGFLEATGKTADPNALTGRGEIALRDGKLQQYSLLVALGQILQIDELMQLQLDQAEVKYHINPGIVTIDQLVLRSPNIRLTATGAISFSGKLHLDAQLALNDKIRRQLFAPIRENFAPLPSLAGYGAVDFKVNGTIDRPRTNLMDKLVGRDLRDLGGVISSLFGRHKKKTRPQAPPASTAIPSPNEQTSPTPGAEPEASPTPAPDEPTATPSPKP